MNKEKKIIKYFTEVTATAIFNGFSHSFNDFHPLFYEEEVRLRNGQRATVKKTRAKIIDDIYILVKGIYPNIRYLAIDINFY